MLPRPLGGRIGQEVGISALAHRQSSGRRATVSVPATSPEPLSASAVIPQDAEDPAIAPTQPTDQRPAREQLTTVVRYYRAWTQYIQEYRTEPRDTALSQFLADRGPTGRGGTAVNPSTLRRYFPEFRIYTAWTQYLQEQGRQPTADELAQLLANRGLTTKPYTAAKVKTFLDDFPRRRAALGDRADSNT